jgi:acetylglutamate kinase
MKSIINKAEILTEALPYIKKFSGITVVIKYGGAALVNEEIKSTIIKDEVCRFQAGSSSRWWQGY